MSAIEDQKDTLAGRIGLPMKADGNEIQSFPSSRDNRTICGFIILLEGG